MRQPNQMPQLAPPPPLLAPYLFYEDVAGAARFLQDAFGFTLGFTSLDPDGGFAHAQLTYGTARIMLGHAGGGGLNLVMKASALPAPHAAVYVSIEDVDVHCERARAAKPSTRSDAHAADARSRRA
ncbi:MAG TPA: VOC family protein [Polyangiaceae bacterium]|nr:VOC family protein [Polyangiaceae bacterium]